MPYLGEYEMPFAGCGSLFRNGAVPENVDFALNKLSIFSKNIVSLLSKNGKHNSSPIIFYFVSLPKMSFDFTDYTVCTADMILLHQSVLFLLSHIVWHIYKMTYGNIHPTV